MKRSTGEQNILRITEYLTSQKINFTSEVDASGTLLTVTVMAKPNSKKERIEVLETGDLVVSVNSPPVDGKANERIVEFLSKGLGIPKRSVALVRGETSKKKLFKLYFLNREGKDEYYYTKKWIALLES